MKIYEVFIAHSNDAVVCYPTIAEDMDDAEAKILSEKNIDRTMVSVHSRLITEF